MQLTPKERLLRTLRGEETDRVPFSPFLAYYFESLDIETQQKGMLHYLEEMGADPLLRGWGFTWKKSSRRCTLRESVTGNKRAVILTTPIGELTTEYTFTANTWFITKHPVKTKEDMKRLQYYYEDLVIEDDYATYQMMLDDIGSRALAVPLVGVDMKSAYQSLIEVWMGTEAVVYLTYDYPDEMAELLHAMQQKNMETVKMTTNSPAETAIFWEDSSTTNVSPSLYQAYIAPEITRWSREFQENGKLLMQHACGHLKAILPMMCEQGIAAVESLSPPPTGNISLQEALEVIPRDMALIGGIEPVTLLDSSMEALAQQIDDILSMTKGRRYILANSDSCPPGVSYEKFLMIAERVKKQRFS